MALINTLRNKMGKFVVAAVAIAILSFVLADLLGPNSTLLGGNSNTIGEVAGQDIDAREYNSRVELLKARYGNPGESQMAFVRNAAWDAIISDVAFKPEFNALGLAVTSDEQIDMVQGRNIDPGIRQQFTNPETGEFNVDQVVATLQSIGNLPANQREQWESYERDLKLGRLRVKYDNLLAKSTFVTSEEAKATYEAQSAIAEVKYLYVPFYTVSDSLVQVTDEQLKDYLNEHEKEFEVEESRSLSYVNFEIKPSHDDTVAFNEAMAALKEEFDQVNDDSIFAKINSDGDFFFNRYTVGQLPELLKLDVNGLVEGQVRGPFYESGRYKLYKISEVSEDTVYSAKARHILFNGADDSAEEKAKARSEAQRVLREIRNGADFAEMAREHGKDGTATRGGDLGWGAEGSTWVPEFEEAVFARTQAGLINRLVETDFGYHIIEVTEPKTNKAFKIATIEREMYASEETRERIYRKADLFAFNSGNYDEFTTNAKNDSLTVLTAQKIDKNARNISNLSGAREIVRWMYNDASVGEVSKIFELDNSYVVSVLTGKVEKGTTSLTEVRNEVSIKVKNLLKADQIISQLNELSGDLDAIADSYGADANVYTSSDLKFNTNSLPSVGFSPKAVGKAFSLEPGERSAPFTTDNGVVIIEMVNFTGAPEIADYTTYKTQKIQTDQSRVSINVLEAVKKFADIEDYRYRFY